MIDPMMLAPRPPPYIVRLTAMPAIPATPQIESATPIVEWMLWLSKERKQIIAPIRDIVAQRRSRIIKRTTPLVSPELPPIILV